MMTIDQPQWTRVATFGDVNPIEHGGGYVYRDSSGRYAEEMEVIVPDDDDDPGSWTIYRVTLDRCTYADGILSDNGDYPTWFADSIDSVANCSGIAPDALRAMFCSEDPTERAEAYRAIGEYHGWDNLDTDPLTIDSREEMEKRYRD